MWRDSKTEPVCPARTPDTTREGAYAPNLNLCGQSRCLCVKHPDILTGKREEFAFATTAIFSRFSNKNPENPILEKKGF
jgi:hypothetical protein